MAISKKEVFWVAMLVIGSVVIGRCWMAWHNSLHAGRQAGLTDADIAAFKTPQTSEAQAPHFSADTPPVLILAAASTQELVSQFNFLYQHQTGLQIKLSTGGSNSLAQQILQGAPADVFLSADPAWVDALAEKGLVDRRVDLVSNDLVLIVPADNPAQIHTPQDLLKPELTHLALAGEKVPAGKYAGQALTKLGLLSALTDGKKIVRGSDVRVACSYVRSGEAQAGIVYASDAFAEMRAADPARAGAGAAPTVAKIALAYTFPADTHDPIVYTLALIKREGSEPAPAAVAVYDALYRLNREAPGWGFKKVPPPVAPPLAAPAPAPMNPPAPSQTPAGAP